MAYMTANSTSSRIAIWLSNTDTHLMLTTLQCIFQQMYNGMEGNANTIKQSIVGHTACAQLKLHPEATLRIVY